MLLLICLPGNARTLRYAPCSCALPLQNTSRGLEGFALPCLATAPPHSSEDEMNQRRHEGAAPKDTLSNQSFFAWKIRKRKDHTRRKIPPPSPSSLPLAVLAPSRQCGRADPLYLSKTRRYLGTEEKQQEKFLSRHIAFELFWCSLEGLSDLQTQRPALR